MARTPCWACSRRFGRTGRTEVAAHRVEVVCHRGANAVAPENTWAAARQCIEWGADYIEVDVRTSRDGVFYVLHDAAVDRTTNGTGRLRDLTSDEIDRLDAGAWFHPRFSGERIPRLEPFLGRVRGKAKVFFDVKDADLSQLLTLVHTVGLENDCFFWFANNADARAFRSLAPHLPLKINVSTMEGVRAAKADFDAAIIETGLDRLTPELVGACQERDIRVMVLQSNNDPDAFRRILEWQIDMVNLNHADTFLAVQRAQADALTGLPFAPR
ncbi:MAG: glycerophosphodiester phosphodiesterase family protein [Betaproteobacteria bacterium]|nr:MAG: glycerophosphodiester phosphodiesterase family protein [Betaproteobacteria bacterium]